MSTFGRPFIRAIRPIGLVLAALVALIGCDESADPGVDAGPPPSDAGARDGAPEQDARVGVDAAVAPDADLADAGSLCGGGPPCPVGRVCRHAVCVPDLGPCTDHGDCPGDAYCDDDAQCVPYGVPPSVQNDPTCARSAPAPGAPTVQCEWAGPGALDPTAGSTSVYTTPIVVDLNLDGDPNRLQPSIVLTTWENVGGVRTGTLRVFDGRTCTEQMRAGGDDEPDDANRPAYGTQWAVGDLDGDVLTGGHPEIIGLHRTAASNTAPLALYGFGVDTSGGGPALNRLWYGRDCGTVTFASNSAQYGPGLWDLDDDGTPEILIDDMVFGADGCLRSTPTDFAYISFNRINTIADVDMDGAPELVMADRIAAWNPTSDAWEDETYFVPSSAHAVGHTAVVDVGQYSTLPGVPTPNDLPEVVVVSAESSAFDPNTTGTIRVQALDGSVVWGPIPLYHTAPETAGGLGGPPLAADFDADGSVELAAAANQYFAVYDPDCQAAGTPLERPSGVCMRPTGSALPDGVAWARLSQDRSSSSTGSSAHDLDGDGAPELIYGDECYARVFDGTTGSVIHSLPASHGTGYEQIAVADVDGDFIAELVIPRSPRGGCPSPDPLFSMSGPAVSTGGFAVVRETEDRWSAARPIWNQHAYQPAQVSDLGQIPRTRALPRYWAVPGSNHFRQNDAQGLEPRGIADLTVALTAFDSLCDAVGGDAELHVEVCNRGTLPVRDGVTVEVLEHGDPTARPGQIGGVLLCRLETTRFLAPGACEALRCDATLTASHNVHVRVDPGAESPDCHRSNNDGATLFELCGSVGE